MRLIAAPLQGFRPLDTKLVPLSQYLRMWLSHTSTYSGFYTDDRGVVSLIMKLTNSTRLTDESDTEILLFTTLPPHTKAKTIVVQYPKF